jgi:prepilin-type N-terminal cleavage/methylation domain-containing protein
MTNTFSVPVAGFNGSLMRFFFDSPEQRGQGLMAQRGFSLIEISIVTTLMMLIAITEKVFRCFLSASESANPSWISFMISLIIF